MKPIRIIATKVGHGHFIHYVNKLSNRASYRKGFINSNSYWVNKDFNTIISISDWADISYWNSWYNSSERMKINNRYKNNINSEKFKILIKRREPNDVFLL